MTPLHERPAPVAISRSVLRALITLNSGVGCLILALLLASLVRGEPVMHALGIRHPSDSAAVIRAMRGIMVIGILAVPLAHVVLTRLLAIVDTVIAQEPFDVGNAARLQTIAWALVGFEVLHVAVGIIARASAETQLLDVGSSFSVTRLLIILLLFVLARVFDDGARMQDELAATV